MKHALENVVMNGKSLEATRATSWAKMSMGFRKQKRSQRSTIWHGSNLPHVCRLEKRNKKREFPVVENHLASRWHHQLPPLLALPWPQQPNSPPNMGSFFVAPSTFGISPGGIAKAIPPPPVRSCRWCSCPRTKGKATLRRAGKINHLSRVVVRGASYEKNTAPWKLTATEVHQECSFQS